MSRYAYSGWWGGLRTRPAPTPAPIAVVDEAHYFPPPAPLYSIATAPQGEGAKTPKREGEQTFLMDTCIAFRATSLEQANKIAAEIAAEIRESPRVVLAHVCLVEADESGCDD